MNARSKAKIGWLIAYADVLTLLITFFMMMLILYKTEVSEIQRWGEAKVDRSYAFLQTQLEKQQLDMFQLKRTAQGIYLRIQNPAAFETASYLPAPELSQQLADLSKLLVTVPLFQVGDEQNTPSYVQQALKGGYKWLVEVRVEGHTDNDPIDPNSRLRNNWFLSAMRAQSVMQALYQQSQLPAQLFSVAGYGEYHPLVANDTVGHKQLNRRVEILITAGFQQETEQLKALPAIPQERLPKFPSEVIAN